MMPPPWRNFHRLCCVCPHYNGYKRTVRDSTTCFECAFSWTHFSIKFYTREKILLNFSVTIKRADKRELEFPLGNQQQRI